MALTVLIVDDSPVMRSFIRRVIRLAGYDDINCVEATDGRDALNRLASVKADVILTDINMPVMNGEEFLLELKNNGTLDSTPALVISTDATHDRAHRMLALGARGYIAKPFSPEALRDQLTSLLGEPDATSN